MKSEHGGNISKAAAEFNLEEKEIIDFSANINFLGPPPAVIDELKQRLKDIVHYPRPGSAVFKEKLAHFLQLNVGNLIIGNGASEIIYLLLDQLAPERILLPVPSFSEYEKAAQKIGASIEYLTLKESEGFSLPLQPLITGVARNDLLILCTPHNPSGRIYPKEKLKEILQATAENDTYLLIDEAFMDFVIDADQYSLISEIENNSHLFIFRSLTKFYAIPGLRLGYGLGAPELLEKMEKNRDPWSVNSLAQAAGEVALECQQYKEKTKKENEKEKEYIYNNLKKLKGLKVFPSTANFVFCKLEKENLNADVLKKQLAKKGLLIRNCSTYRGLDNNFFRLAVKSRENNILLLENLKEILQK